MARLPLQAPPLILTVPLILASIAWFKQAFLFINHHRRLQYYLYFHYVEEQGVALDSPSMELDFRIKFFLF